MLFEKDHLKIKIEYITADFKKESYLINSKREIIEFDNFDVEIGIETNRLCFQAESREQMREELGLDGQYVIGNVGRLCYQKNQG